MMKNIVMFCFLGVFSISFSQVGNHFQGTGAGASITIGDYIVGVGENAAYNSEASTRGVYVGYETGYSSVTEHDHVVIGFRAGYNLDATDITFIGAGSGFSNTTGSDLVFIGDNAGVRATTGHDNTYIGSRAGPSVQTSISQNTTTVGGIASTASDNTAVGSMAGFNLTTGHRNVFVGSDAGHDSTTGYRNTFVGDSTGVDVSIGRLNTFVGQGAGAATEYASFNTFIGTYAGGDNNRNNNTNDAYRNTYVGVFTGFGNREGIDNVGMGAFADVTEYSISDMENAIGRETGNAITTGRDRTTFLGSQAYANANDVVLLGYDTRVDGQYGIAIGAQTRVNNQYAVAIGNNLTVAQNNTMALGGDTTTNRLSVGIGTVSANQNASLDLSDSDKGFLVNRVTNAERTTMVTVPASGIALSASDVGLMVYDTDDKLLYIWDGTQWSEIGGSSSTSGFSGVPDLLNYQSAVRNASGAILASQLVSFRMNVIDVTSGNTTVYSETHNVTTSTQGLVNFEIGGGTIVSGLFTAIDWSHNNSLQIELDVAGGSTYVVMGTTSFVSVPYALRAKYAENLTSSSNARMRDSSKDDRIEALENETAKLKSELQELKRLVNQLIKK